MLHREFSAEQVQAVRRLLLMRTETTCHSLLSLLEQEVIQREDNQMQLRLKAAGFPVLKRLDAFDFATLPALNKQKVLALSQAEFVKARENSNGCARTPSYWTS